MTSDDRIDEPAESTPAGHPASDGGPVSAGEALSGTGGPDGALGERPSDMDRTDDTEALRARAPRPESQPGSNVPMRTEPPSADLDAEDVIEDAIEYFTDEPAGGSPASESDAPAPG